MLVTHFHIYSFHITTDEKIPKKGKFVKWFLSAILIFFIKARLILLNSVFKGHSLSLFVSVTTWHLFAEHSGVKKNFIQKKNAFQLGITHLLAFWFIRY